MPADKIKLIYNGANPAGAFEGNALFREFGVNPGRVVFVSLMRVTPIKGPMFLLEAAKKLSGETDKPFTLVISGDGELLPQAKAYADKHLPGSVVFTGYQDEPGRILAASHIYVNSSQSEALSLAILEGMSYGLPVIATDVGGNPEVVEAAGCGVLVPYGDVAAMAAAMGRCLLDEGFRKDQGKKSLYAAQNTFGAKRAEDETFEVYKSVLQ